MSSQKPSIPKGTRDFGPAEVQKRRYILSTIERVFKKYGFMPIETPAMENLSTLEGKYGDEGDQLLFRIINSGNYLKELIEHNDRILADESQDRTYLPSFSGQLNDLDHRSALPFITEKGLRYDLTVPFARYVVMHRNEITFPFKRYQMQPVWRADRPQKGRYREFWQCDADVVGSDSLLNELDLIQIYDETFRELRITNYELRINHRKILAGMANKMGISDRLSEFVTILDKQDKIGWEGVKSELQDKGLLTNTDVLQEVAQLNTSSSNKDLISQYEISSLGMDETFKTGLNELKQLFRFLDALPDKINIKFDPYLARGLSYYTGCIMEVLSTEGTLRSSIGGGGRYDNLTGIFGLPDVSGVGISFGLDRIYDVMEELNLFPENLNITSTRVLICAFDQPSQEQGVGLLKQLRNAGIAAEIYPDLPKTNKERDKPMLKPMNYAEALQIPFTLIIKENGRIILKDMRAKTEEEPGMEEIITKLNPL